MVSAIIVLLLKTLLALALATFALAWVAGLVTVIAFGLDVYCRTESFNPLEWFAYLRWSRDRAGIPAEISHIQLWQRRIFRTAVLSIGIAAFAGISLAVADLVQRH